MALEYFVIIEIDECNKVVVQRGLQYDLKITTVKIYWKPPISLPQTVKQYISVETYSRKILYLRVYALTIRICVCALTTTYTV